MAEIAGPPSPPTKVRPMEDGTTAGAASESSGADRRIALGTVVRFVDIAVDALAEAREEIDALNVYPVPDGDTGTNLYLTDRWPPGTAVREAQPAPLAPSGRRSSRRCSRGALLGARGNSGVILS